MSTRLKSSPSRKPAPCANWLHRMVRRFVHWKYVVLTHKDYAALLNRSVEVETVLLAGAAGKREMVSPEECLALAYKLGVPAEFRSPSDKMSH